MSTNREEVGRGERFTFGANWQTFLQRLTDQRVSEATESLKAMLGLESLQGKRFLDAGSGSGLFSLAARRLGAEVVSFDYDPDSVACTKFLRDRFFPNDNRWIVIEGSVLDEDFLGELGQFDIVYSWGVLHHTGAMWRAIDNVMQSVKVNGLVYIAIYNDQGGLSHAWLKIKKAYNRLPPPFRWLVWLPVFFATWGPVLALDLFRGRLFISWTSYGGARGMSPWVDFIDWVGGLPFEVAKPEAIFDCFSNKGYVLTRLTTRGGHSGCNEYVFRRL